MSMTKRAMDERAYPVDRPAETTAIQHVPPLPEAIAAALVEGDLSKLTVEQRNTYFVRTCQSLGLNPLTRPFRFLRLNGQIVMYATKDATDQLRKLYAISLKIEQTSIQNGVMVVTAKATDKAGRGDSDVGAVFVEGLKGEALANAIMKAHTKAKRRVTLSICGLGMLDESEVDAVPGAQVISDALPERDPEEERRESAMVACRDEIESATNIEQIAASLRTAKPRVNAGQMKELQARATRRRKEIEAERDVPQESPNAEPEGDGRLPGED